MNLLVVNYVCMKKLLIFLLIVIMGIGLFFVAKNFVQPSVNTEPVTTQVTTEPTRRKEDVNWDEMVNQTDANMVKTQLNCKKTDPCWNKVIGKTMTGDNPIYAFDLDMNTDGVIDQKDMNQVLSIK